MVDNIEPMANHPRFWIELLGKLGPPTCAATMVGCLLARDFEWMHAVLLAVGIAFIAIHHWYELHSGG